MFLVVKKNRLLRMTCMKKIEVFAEFTVVIWDCPSKFPQKVLLCSRL